VTKGPPPERFTGTPAVAHLPAGTVLSRVHLTKYPSTAFNPVEADVLFGGGRFDGTAGDPYPYLYAGDSDPAAVAEVLLRDLDADDYGARFLPKKYWRGRCLSRLRTTQEVKMIALRTGSELGAIGQDAWLTTCDADDYPQTRAWAHWLRGQVPDAAGIMWLSKRDPGATVYVLFQDRCPAGLVVPEPGPLVGDCELDASDGFEWLRQTLASYRVGIRE
jgi:hypothetical protein